MVIVEHTAGRHNAAFAALFNSCLSCFGVGTQLLKIIIIGEGEALYDIFIVSSVSCRQQLLNVNCEFNGITRGSCPQVILPSLETLLPSMEMHGSHFSKVGLSHVNIEAL